jgi:hypothetical protein
LARQNLAPGRFWLSSRSRSLSRALYCLAIWLGSFTHSSSFTRLIVFWYGMHPSGPTLATTNFLASSVYSLCFFFLQKTVIADANACSFIYD